MNKKTIALIGNPNSGKTTLFNLLTGSKQKVGNWPGVTVERKTGKFKSGKYNFEVIDLPGIYSISSSHASSKSLDETIAQNFIFSEKYDYIVNIIDASNLDRALYLTSQLIDMQVPLVLVLNMLDIAKKRSIEIDVEQMSKDFGVPIIPITAKKKTAKAKVIKAFTSYKKTIPNLNPKLLDSDIENAISEVSQFMKGDFKRWNSVRALKNPDIFNDSRKYKSIKKKVKKLQTNLGEDLTDLITKSRYEFIGKIINDVVTKPKDMIMTKSDSLDKLILHKWLGIPIFLGVMYLMFLFTINIGSAFVDLFDITFGAIFVDGFKVLLERFNTPNIVRVILADGIGGGIQTVATFIPILLFLYIFLSILEDSGYMSRAGVIMDRFMKKLGLSGKAFVPLTIGFGCTVPAVMSARTIESVKDRIAVIMMAPFMSCGAKLPVYVLFSAIFFPKGGQNIIFLLYLIGILAGVFTGLIFKSAVKKEKHSPLLIDLPPYNFPRIKDIFLNTWNRIKVFIFGSGKVIVIIVMILTILNSLGTDGTFGNKNTEKAVLSNIGKAITPAFKPIGIKNENWPATVGIFTGIFAKEVVVGTLDSLYSQMEIEEGVGVETDEFNLLDSFKKALLQTKENLSDLKNSIYNPLGISVGDLSDREKVAEENELETSTLSVMQRMFDGKIGAFAYLLFILLYTPCLATIAVIYRELNSFWAIVVALWTFTFAYLMSTLFYQTATFYRYPNTAILWIIGVLALLSIIVWFLKKFGGKYINQDMCILKCSSKKCKKKCSRNCG